MHDSVTETAYHNLMQNPPQDFIPSDEATTEDCQSQNPPTELLNKES